MPEFNPITPEQAKSLLSNKSDDAKDFKPISKEDAEKLIKGESISQPKGNTDLYTQIKNKNASVNTKQDKPFYETANEELQKPVLGDKDYLSRTIKESAKVKDKSTSIQKIQKDKQASKDYSDDLFKNADELNIPELKKELEEKVKQERIQKENELKLTPDETGHTGDIFEIQSKLNESLKNSDNVKELKLLQEAELRDKNFKARLVVESKLPQASDEEKYFEQLKLVNPEKAKAYESKVLKLQEDINKRTKEVEDRFKNDPDKSEKVKAYLPPIVHEQQILLEKEKYQFTMESKQATISHLGDNIVKVSNEEERNNFSEYQRNKKYIYSKVPVNASDKQLEDMAKKDPAFAKAFMNAQEYEKNSEYYKTITKSSEKENAIRQEQADLIKDNQYLAYSEFEKLKNKSQSELDKLYKDNYAYKAWAVTGSPAIRAAVTTLEDIALKTPRTVSDMFGNNYSWADNIADLAILHADVNNTTGFMGMPSSFTTPLLYKYADITHGAGKYKVIVDEDNKPISVRDKDNFSIDKDLEQKIISEFDAIPDDKKGVKNSGMTGINPMQLTNMVAYQGIQMFAIGGIANGISKGAMVLKMGQKGAETVGMLASNFAVMNGNFYEQAIQQPNVTKKEAAWFAFTASNVQGLMMKINPMEMRFFDGQGRISLSKAFGENMALGLSKEQAFKKALSEQVFKNIPLENAKMVATNYATAVVGQGISHLGDNADLNVKMPDANNVLETVITVTLSSLPMSFKAGRQDYSGLQKEALYHVYETDNPSKILTNLERLKNNGTINNEQYANVVKKVEHIREAKKEIDALKQLTKTTSKDEYDILPLVVDKKALKESERNADGIQKEKWKLKVEAKQAEIGNFITKIDERNKAEEELKAKETTPPAVQTEVQKKDEQKEKAKETADEIAKKKEANKKLLEEEYHPVQLSDKEFIKDEIDHLNTELGNTEDKSEKEKIKAKIEALAYHLNDLIGKSDEETVDKFKEHQQQSINIETTEGQELVNLAVSEQVNKLKQQIKESDKKTSVIADKVKELTKTEEVDGVKKTTLPTVEYVKKVLGEDLPKVPENYFDGKSVVEMISDSRYGFNEGKMSDDNFETMLKERMPDEAKKILFDKNNNKEGLTVTQIKTSEPDSEAGKMVRKALEKRYTEKTVELLVDRQRWAKELADLEKIPEGKGETRAVTAPFSALLKTYRDFEGLRNFRDIVTKIHADYPEINLEMLKLENISTTARKWIEGLDDIGNFQEVFNEHINTVEYKGKTGGEAIRVKIDDLISDFSGKFNKSDMALYKNLLSDIVGKDVDFSHLTKEDIKDISKVILHDIDNIPDSELTKVLQDRILDGYEMRESEDLSIIETIVGGKKTSKSKIKEETIEKGEKLKEKCDPLESGGMAFDEEVQF